MYWKTSIESRFIFGIGRNLSYTSHSLTEFSDVSIVVGLDGEVFPAHKLILSARCEYFRNMFYGSGMREARDGTCRFEHDDPRVFKTMLYHLYSRPLDESPEPRHLVMCLITAEKFGIGKISSLLCSFSPSFSFRFF